VDPNSEQGKRNMEIIVNLSPLIRKIIDNPANIKIRNLVLAKDFTSAADKIIERIEATKHTNPLDIAA
jgi:hypothetical protein